MIGGWPYGAGSLCAIEMCSGFELRLTFFQQVFYQYFNVFSPLTWNDMEFHIVSSHVLV